MIPDREANSKNVPVSHLCKFVNSPNMGLANKYIGTKNTTPQKNWRRKFWRENLWRRESIHPAFYAFGIRKSSTQTVVFQENYDTRHIVSFYAMSKIHRPLASKR